MNGDSFHTYRVFIYSMLALTVLQTSPFLWYFYSAIPRCLLLTIVLVPFGLSVKNKGLLGLLASAMFFVFAYSFLPHKELRFIIYVVPILNTAAAAGVIEMLVGLSCLLLL